MKAIYTVGHSTRPIEEFIDTLKAYGITALVDIRSIRGSRHNPQFSEQALHKSILNAGVSYVPISKLGGLRKKADHSANTAWRNASFRNYADYMQTDDFKAGLDELVEIAGRERVAIMCSEVVPWRCHRSLVGDALLAKGIKVIDIFDTKTAKNHTLTSFAKVGGGTVTYPGEEEEND